MLYMESDSTELKAMVTGDIAKEIVAFANTHGGTLYVGVEDNGEILGVSNPDETIQQIGNMVRDAIKPDVTIFVRYKALTEGDKSIVSAEVQRGSDRPYYLAKKGLRPEGVYVRQGTSSAPASESAIRKMIKETDGDSFEAMRSMEQELTFMAAEAEFAERELAFGEIQRKSLGLISRDDIYTHLALLLSDQCPHTVKAATFEGTDQSVFKDRREFSGSLLQQLNEVYAYIDLRNGIRATFEGLRRIDSFDYPKAAVREALLNSLVHRDYSFSASTLIGVYADRIEFISIGGLLPGVSLNDVMMGLSVCRNPKLANVFYRLELLEAYGTGMRKIMNAYTDSGKTPALEVTDNAFKITLPNLSIPSIAREQIAADLAETDVLKLVTDKGVISRNDVEKAFQLPQTTAGRLIKSLLDKGVLVQQGNGRTTKYRLKE